MMDNTIALKYVSNISKGRKPKNEFLEPSEELLPYLSMDYLRGRDNITSYVDVSDERIVLVENDDILIIWDGSNAGEIVFGKKGVLSSTMAKIDIENPDFSKRFSAYFLISKEQKLRFNTVGMGIPHVSGDYLKSLRLPTLSLPEQEKIADYLDKQTEKIDLIISKKEKLLELLEEKKKSLINDAVTGKKVWKNGQWVQPDKTKDSGIDWLGEIPEDWEVRKFNWCLELKNSQRVPLSATVRGERQGKYPYYGASGIIDYIDDFIYEGEYILLAEDGANIISRSTPLAFIAKGQFWVNNHAHVIDAKENNIHFICKQLEARDYNGIVSGSAQPKLTAEVISSLEILLPGNIKQQEIIGSYLIEIGRKFSELNSNLTLQIEKLKEYRQALISEAVSGKVDLR